MEVIKLEVLTGELKSLIGWGAYAKRLIARPVLRSLFDVEALDSVTAGYVMRSRLIESIDGWNGMAVLFERQYPAERFNRATKLLLGLERPKDSAEARRRRVMALLAWYGSLETWRRPHGPERELMRMLSVHLLAQRA